MWHSFDRPELLERSEEITVREIQMRRPILYTGIPYCSDNARLCVRLLIATTVTLGVRMCDSLNVYLPVIRTDLLSSEHEAVEAKAD